MRWRWALLLLAVLAAGLYVYDAARPRVHPIKRADAARMAALAHRPAVPEPTPASREPLPAQPPGELFGDAVVVDGDTLRIGGTEVDLWTIDAPELAQTCHRDGRPWQCGAFARDELATLIGGRNVACRPEGPDASHFIGLCFVRDTPCAGEEACESSNGSLNLAMVARGAAVDIEGQFMDDESDAEDRKRGLWAGSFDLPSERAPPN
jgi:endonuclease YncB( thermonuclease family)